MSAASVLDSTASNREVGRGSNPTAALHSLRVQPISFVAAKKLIVENHYLHSLPGGTKLTFGVILNGRLAGAITFGVGPFNAYRLVKGAQRNDCLTLTRLWLSDELPTNSESKVIAISLRAIRKNTHVRFVVSYADPSKGHAGTIYQAAGWTYTGLSEATPMFELGDGISRHSRTLAHRMGTHALGFLREKGLDIQIITQSKKHRYIYFIEESLRTRLTVPVLPYPKKPRVSTFEGTVKI